MGALQLTKLLLRLDGVLSEGDAELRALRKAQVKRCLELGDREVGPMIKRLQPEPTAEEQAPGAWKRAA